MLTNLRHELNRKMMFNGKIPASLNFVIHPFDLLEIVRDLHLTHAPQLGQLPASGELLGYPYSTEPDVPRGKIRIRLGSEIAAEWDLCD